jgi:hypothetical protein
MKNQSHGRTALFRMVVSAFKPPVRAGKHNLRHGVPNPLLSCLSSRTSGHYDPAARLSEVHATALQSPRNAAVGQSRLEYPQVGLMCSEFHAAERLFLTHQVAEP